MDKKIANLSEELWAAATKSARGELDILFV